MKFTDGLFALLAAVLSVAIVAVLVSGNSRTSDVFASFGEAFSKILSVAVSPITGGGNNAFGN